MKKGNTQGLRRIPSVTDVLESPPLKSLVERINHGVLVGGVRNMLEDLRTELQGRTDDIPIPPVRELAEAVARRLLNEEQPTLRPVINATGIMLHTGLGRAPLPDEAVAAITEIAAGYSSVEFDLATGSRNSRGAAVEALLRDLTGAEAALVVNNNSAALVLALASLATNRSVIVSRGQLVEIGGSFRLPDIMETSGALLREVGTTNKTRISDYADAVDDQTAALLRVHTSNFRVTGFTESPPLKELVQLAERRRLVLIDDIGSGALNAEINNLVGGEEPTVEESLSAGAHLVLFSGDKLLGGPQAGIILGQKKLVSQLASHPLARAFRVDKLALAALSATLRLYRRPESDRAKIPLIGLLQTPLNNLHNRGERIVAQLAECPDLGRVELVQSESFVGGGSVPTAGVDTWCVVIEPSQMQVDEFARRLRQGTPPVVARIQNDQLLFDLRTVFPHQDSELVAAIESISASPQST